MKNEKNTNKVTRKWNNQKKKKCKLHIMIKLIIFFVVNSFLFSYFSLV